MKRLGKKIDTWSFNIDGVVVEVELRLTGSPGEQKFNAVAQSHEVNIVNVDVNALRIETLAALRQRLSVEWERFFMVSITGRGEQKADDGDDDDGDDDGGSYSGSVKSYFSYKTIEIGTFADGTKVHRDVNRHSDHPKETFRKSGTTRKGVPETGVDDRWDNETAQTSMIPATEVNRVALLSLRDSYLKLNSKLFDLLHPDRIAANIAAVPQLRITG